MSGRVIASEMQSFYDDIGEDEDEDEDEGGVWVSVHGSDKTDRMLVPHSAGRAIAQ